MESNVNKKVMLRHTSTSCIAVIFIFLLATMRCWIGFGGVKNMMVLAFPVLMFMCYVTGLVRLSFKKRYVLFSLIIGLVSLVLLKDKPNIIGIIFEFVPAVGILFVLSIADNEKEYVFAKIVKWFGALMMISIPIYLVNLIVTLPSLGTIVADYGSKTMIAGNYLNYFFYIKPLEILDGSSTLRFNGPFIEPGDLGCVAAFMLMATRFDFRRYKCLWAILAALFLSFSLAGYLLALFAYVCKLLCENRMKRGTIIVISILLFVVYLFGTFYNGGENFLNETILSRLQLDEDKGFTGNNRTSLLNLQYFIEMFQNPHTLLFGYDKQTIEILFEERVGAGFINQAIIVGMLGMVGLALPFIYFAFSAPRRKYAVLFFIFFLLYFFQRSDITWIAIVMSYVYGIVIYERDHNQFMG